MPFGLPLLTLVDTPGFLPGRDLEWGGMIRYGGQLAFAYAEADVPRMCVIVRKAYGGAFIVMDCKTMGNDVCFAWPTAEVAVMGAPGAIQILHNRDLAQLEPEAQEAKKSELIADYEATHLNPDEARRRGFVDQLIEPEATRAALCAALPSLLHKRRTAPERKHSNGPM